MPEKTLWLILLMMLFSLVPGKAEAETKGGEKGNREVERYRYEAVPRGGNGEEKELVEIEVRDGELYREYLSKVTGAGTEEVIRITVDREGRFVDGARTLSDRAHKRLSSERVWLAVREVHVEKVEGGEKKVKRRELPRDKELAVDGSLLMLFRSFPFATGKEWQVYMVDFSGASIGVTVRQAGKEQVVVPAGEMECYRMEVVVDIPLLRPKITYWITTSEPHFLVKNEGRRGPFTSAYVTSLLSYGWETVRPAGKIQ